MGDDPTATWKSKIINGIRKTITSKDVGITTLCLFEKIQNLMTDLQCEPEHFKDRIIFMSMYNDIEWKAKRNKERCEYNSQTVANQCSQIPRGHWSFLGPGPEEKWCGTYTDTPDGSWTQPAENCWLISQDPVIQYFVPPVPLREENYEAKTVVMKTSSFFSAQ